MNKHFMYFLLVLLLVPTAFAAQPITIEERFQVFVDGFDGIDRIFSRGGFNSAPMVRGFIAILPVTGLIAIVFGLMFFVTKISIFKSPEHDRYARMIAFGIALIGLAMPAVYNAVLGLSTAFLILVFILAVVFIFIMFTNYNRKLHLQSYGELHKITGDTLSAKRDLEKIRHELNMEQKLRDKTTRDLAMVDSDLNNISHLVGNELQQVDKIANLLRKATASYKSGDSQAVDQFVKALTKDLGGLITTMQHEQNHSHHLASMVSQIESELAKWGHSADKGMSEEEHLKKLFKKFSQTWGHSIEDDELKKVYEDEDKLQHKLYDMMKRFRNHLHNLQAFFDRIMADEEDLEKASYERKHLEANAVRDNIMNQQFSEAHKHLDNLRALIEYEPHVIKKFRAHASELHSLLSHITAEENHINQLIKNKILKKLLQIRREADKNKSKDKDKVKKINKVIPEAVLRSLEDLKKYRSHAKSITVTIRDVEDDFGERRGDYKQTFDLPSKLLARFVELEGTFADLYDAIQKDEKDAGALQKHLMAAVVYLETFEKLHKSASRTIDHVDDHGHTEFANVIRSIKDLLEESVVLYRGRGNILKQLKDLRKDL